VINFSERFIVKPRHRVKLRHFDPDDTARLHKTKAVLKLLDRNVSRLADLEYRLAAENRRSLLIVLQGMDTAGKDGTIRHVMSGLNPQTCRVTSFKEPSAEEARHDFLWRIHKAVPGCGEIGIFNRSQYEDVLVVRVHDLVPPSVWSKRYDQINQFERLLTENNVTVLKLFLHISKDEQLARLQDRLADPAKNWKISEADFHERKRWHDYVKAYEDALGRCSTPYAPWFVIPANKKWFRNLAVSQIIVETLQKMDPQLPKPSIDLSTIKLR
jgi:PPK2 family polyphosphate:nucleotide phosphotransferase